MNHKVSVIIRAHGEAEFLNKTIESIENQKSLNQIIVVVDRPSHNLKKTLGNYKSNPYITFVNLDYANLSRALNLGILNSRNNLIAIIDGDDTMNSNRLELQANFLVENEKIPVVGSNFFQIDLNDKVIKNVKMPYLLNKGSFIHWEFCPVAHSTVMFRKDVILEFGGYSEKYEFAEDYDLWMKINKHFAICNLPEFLTNYRIHGTQTTASNFLKISRVKVAVDIENGLSLRKIKAGLQRSNSIEDFYNNNIFNMFLWYAVFFELTLHKINYFINKKRTYRVLFYRLILFIFFPKKTFRKIRFA
jgi:glycosyltransferase involved in cell wall biosynthesis